MCDKKKLTSRPIVARHLRLPLRFESVYLTETDERKVKLARKKRRYFKNEHGSSRFVYVRCRIFSFCELRPSDFSRSKESEGTLACRNTSHQRKLFDLAKKKEKKKKNEKSLPETDRQTNKINFQDV